MDKLLALVDNVLGGWRENIFCFGLEENQDLLQDGYHLFVRSPDEAEAVEKGNAQ